MNTLLQCQSLPVTYVVDSDQLDGCIAAIKAATIISIDLEFDRDHYTYGFDLCLMQVATSTHCYLVDPKVGADVERVFPLLESEKIEKVVHCSGEDLRLLHSLKCYPKNIADTEIYAKLLNYERTSLSSLLQLFFGLELDKKMQKINWTLRPLNQDQLMYAANDVRYLIALKSILEKEAKQKGLLQFLAEENELLSTTIHSSAAKENFLKKNDLRFLSPFDQYILNEMFRYRDGLARKHNKPAHHIISEALLREIVLSEHQTNHSDLSPVHFSLKSPNGRKDFFETLALCRQQAIDLDLDKKRKRSAGTSANGNNENDGFDREWAEQQKNMVFKPIQNAIANEFGEHSMRFIFSSTLINALLGQQLKISELKTASRRQLIRDTAAKLQVDISAFE